MAESDSTLGTRFAESIILANLLNLHSTVHFMPGLSAFSNENFNGTMETLRSHVNYLLSLPLPVREKNRLLLNYWEHEFLNEELQLLLDQVLDNSLSLNLSLFDFGKPP